LQVVQMFFHAKNGATCGLAFESFKHHVNKWWDGYINWIQNVQLQTM